MTATAGMLQKKEEDLSQSNATVGGMCHLSENQKKKKCFCVCQPASIIMKTKSTIVAFSQKYQSFFLPLETVIFLHTVCKTRPCPHIC